MMDTEFWTNVVNAWISIQPEAETAEAESFAQMLVQKENERRVGQVPSIFDELFGGED